MKKLLIVIGAGGSIEFGMPSVHDIDKLFEEWSLVNYKIIGDYKGSLYTWVKNRLIYPDHITLSFEDYLRAIQIISERGKGTYNIEGIECSINIEHFPEKRIGTKYTEAVTPESFDHLNTFLNDKLLSYIRNKCVELNSIHHKGIQEANEFFSFLQSKYELGFINLNYDNVLISAIPNLHTGFNQNTGEFDLSSIYKNKWGFCYHIHGSVHFDMKKGEEISWTDDLGSKFGLGGPNRRRHTTPEGRRHSMSTIITGFDKINQLYREPFKQYFFKSDQRVYESDAILFIGYGFSDTYLNEIIKTHARDKGKRRNIVVIDYKNENTKSLSESGDRWGNRLLNTVHTSYFQMGNGSSNALHIPDKVAAYKKTRTFEFSYSINNPVYVWYSGFLEACRNKEKVIQALDGYKNIPYEWLSSETRKYH